MNKIDATAVATIAEVVSILAVAGIVPVWAGIIGLLTLGIILHGLLNEMGYDPSDTIRTQ
jgi:hypothetical protein